MAIKFNETEKIFSIHTKNSTYQMKVDAYGFLLHLYYGAKTEQNMSYLLQYYDRGFAGNPYDAGGDRGTPVHARGSNGLFRGRAGGIVPHLS